MPSFDIVSEVNMHEAANAVDQANREVSTRFDFKGTGAVFELKDSIVILSAEVEFQLQQMLDILQAKLVKRGVDIACLQVDRPQTSGKQARQVVTIQQGIDADLARSLVKMIKDTKLKVQSAIQGEKVRITGKKRDVLQEVIQFLRDAKIKMPLQYINFRD